MKMPANHPLQLTCPRAAEILLLSWVSLPPAAGN
jgi:hypothetical protein